MLLGLEFTRRGCGALLCDSTGKVLQRGFVAFVAGSTPAQQWIASIAMARDACFRATLEIAQLTAIALVFDGPLDEQGRVLNSVETTGWAGYDLPRALREHLGVPPVSVESRTVALARAEARFGRLKDQSNWLFLHINRKISGAAQIGERFFSVEAGALVLDRGGPMDDNGRRGTFATYCSRNALEANAQKYGIAFKSPTEIWDLAPSNFAAQSLAVDFTERMAQGLGNLIVALRPRLICIGGDFGRGVLNRIESELAFKLREMTPPRALENLEMLPAFFEDEDAGLWGAIAVALDVLEQTSLIQNA